jgi:polysaccharide export outer membrane protein
MRLPMLVAGLMISLTLSGCAGNSRYQARSFDEINAPYTLASGDRLRVIVFGQDSLSNSYAVDGSGHIAMPLIGAVPAQGYTTDQLARVIETRLRAGYLREPKVAVEVEAFRPFFVLGEITTAGQYPYINGMTVQNAVAVAGGYSPRAFKGTVDLTRVVNGVPVTYSVPPTHPLRPGDTITVRERLF